MIDWDNSFFVSLPPLAKLLLIFLDKNELNSMSAIDVEHSRLLSVFHDIEQLQTGILELRTKNVIKIKSIDVNTDNPKYKILSCIDFSPRLFVPLDNGQSFEITNDYINELSELYAGVNVRDKLIQCIRWNANNPSKRKTERGIKRHIENFVSGGNSNYSQTKTKNEQVVANSKINPPEQKIAPSGLLQTSAAKDAITHMRNLKNNLNGTKR